MARGLAPVGGGTSPSRARKAAIERAIARRHRWTQALAHAGDARHAARTPDDAAPAGRPRALRIACCRSAVQGACDWITQVASAVGQHSGSDAASERFVLRLRAIAPYVAFVALPVFAAIVASFHRHRSLRFGVHLAFAAHLHAFWFLVATSALFGPADLAFAAAVIAPGYAMCSLHPVDGGHWAGTVLRAIGIALRHLACCWRLPPRSRQHGPRVDARDPALTRKGAAKSAGNRMAAPRRRA